MRWVDGQLKAALSKLPHLLKNVDDLQSRLVNFRLRTSCRFLKLHVKDFYLSGDHSLLTSLSASILHADERPDFRLMGMLKGKLQHWQKAARFDQVRSGHSHIKTAQPHQGSRWVRTRGLFPSDDWTRAQQCYLQMFACKSFCKWMMSVVIVSTMR